MYTIKLSDGSTLSGLNKNGELFFSTTEIKHEFFAGKLQSVEITSSDENEHEKVGTFGPMKLTQCQKYDNIMGLPNGYYFGLKEYTAEELELKKLRADIDYTAIMLNIDMEE